MEPDALALVEQWHRLLNEDAIDALLALIADDVEVGGPRGATRGKQAFREWFDRAGIQLIPIRVFRRDNTFVVGENAHWRAQAGAEPASNRAVWTVFTVAYGLIAGIIRFDSLAAALARAGLAETDEVGAAE